MALNSHIQKLCDDSLDELFSKENWEKIQRRKKNKDIKVICKFYRDNFLKIFYFSLIFLKKCFLQIYLKD